MKILLEIDPSHLGIAISGIQCLYCDRNVPPEVKDEAGVVRKLLIKALSEAAEAEVSASAKKSFEVAK